MKKILLMSFLLLSFLGSSVMFPQSAAADAPCTADGEGYCIDLVEPIAGENKVTGDNGVELFSNYIGIIYRYGASIIGIVCVLVIVVSGIQISMGGANSEFVNQGKERIMQALLSLILLFASALILRTINPGFFNTDPVGPTTTLVPNTIYEVLV